MKKRVMIYVVSALLLTTTMYKSVTWLHGIFKPSISNIINEKNYRIQNQQEKEVILSIPKTKITDAIYTSEGQTFEKNEVVVYETETTSIYLYKIMKSNESKDYLYFMFDCDYSVSDQGTVLVPYKKAENNSFSYELNLVNKDLRDDVTIYPESLSIRGYGDNEKFAFYCPTDICKMAVGTMKIDISINEVKYTEDK